ncbi:MAG: alanine racemase [Parvularculaceae bacterium]
MAGAARLSELETPALLLDEGKLDRNIALMKQRMDAHGVRLRPHIKTVKSAEAFMRAMPGAVGVAVSTLAEAEYANANGVTDILYAVGMAPVKLDRAFALIAAGADLKMTIDSFDAAKAISSAAAARGRTASVVIEIDSDDHRAGVKPASNSVLEIARFLSTADGGAFAGVMTHAGASYQCGDVDAIRQVAEAERRAVVDTADMLRQAGITCDIVSVGSTPTAVFGDSFDGVSEVRAGVYLLNDLTMAGLGVCALDDIAASVLSTVIGHQCERNWLLIDAGWMALSSDRSTAGHRVDQGYGVVCDIDGTPIDDLIVISANQEHGVVAKRDGGRIDFSRFGIGDPVRVLPNHACATTAQFDRYHVVNGGRDIQAVWPRINRW